MEVKILNEIYKKVEGGQRAALVIITKNKGSAPGREGSTMAVFEDGTTLGTVGGGAIEFDLIKRSRQAMEKGEDFEFDYNLSQSGELKMACGGESQGIVKTFYPNNNLIIFGAGHVSQKLARVAVKTGFNVYVTDDRDEFRESEDFKGIREYYIGKPEEVVDKLKFSSENTFIVICTRGHSNDEEALKVLLGKKYKYLGMIGSKRKVATIIKNLKANKFTEEEIKSINMPIGLKIDDGSAEEIAISILAEILMVKNSGNGDPNKVIK
ncbi:MAG: XdhC family protein [Peptoniphilaceae bacterium]